MAARARADNTHGVRLGALPRLRYVDAVPVEVDGQRMIYLRDPEGLAKEGVGVAPHVYNLMTMLDGVRV